MDNPLSNTPLSPLTPIRRERRSRGNTSTVLAILGIVVTALIVGYLGFKYIVGLEWDDAVVNTTFFLSGLGPANNATTLQGKMFSSLFSMFSGIIFAAIISLLVDRAVDETDREIELRR